MAWKRLQIVTLICSGVELRATDIRFVGGLFLQVCKIHSQEQDRMCSVGKSDLTMASVRKARSADPCLQCHGDTDYGVVTELTLKSHALLSVSANIEARPKR